MSSAVEAGLRECTRRSAGRSGPARGAPSRAGSRLFRRLPPGLDLRDEVQLETLLQLADGLLDRVDEPEDLASVESVLEGRPTDWPLAARVAVKLARSKATLARRPGALHVSVVMPVYAEHERMLRPAEHPLGEGFLDRKVRQLEWLLDARRDQHFTLWVVDDGCPHDSGRLAASILARRHPHAPSRVLHLEHAIEAGSPVLDGLASARRSRKGGAVQLGLWEAARLGPTGVDHVVVYTDADLSTHLGQTGLLVSALDAPGIRIAAGSRRARTSVVVKPAGRSARGRLFIYLWKKLLPELAYLDDTQCGFKAMRAEDVPALLEEPRERGFAFDLELLLRAEWLRRRAIAPVPIAWVDSDAASTTAADSPYLPMLRSVVELSRRFGRGRALSEAFAAAIERLDEASWQRAIERFGPMLERVDPALDREHLPLTPAQLVSGVA